MRARTLLAALAFTGLVLACSDDDLLLPATDKNREDTVTLGGLFSNGNVDIPSAYFIGPGTGAVKTWISVNFDFAYDIDSIVGPALYPAEITGLVPHAASNPGLKPVAVPFDSIRRADRNGYITDALLPIAPGDVFMARSAVRCTNGVPRYAKVEIMSIDSVAKTMTFRVLRNNNCGYRGLEPGIPEE